MTEPVPTRLSASALGTSMSALAVGPALRASVSSITLTVLATAARTSTLVDELL